MSPDAPNGSQRKGSYSDCRSVSQGTSLKPFAKLKIFTISSQVMARHKPPRTAIFKDSIVAQLALQSHFAISDDHPSDKSLTELSILMFQHVPNAGSGAFKGKYYDACVRFAGMKLNTCTLDQLFRNNTLSYFNGDNLWRKAQEVRRILQNEIHPTFCQNVCPQWPTVPSGTTTLDPLMLELRKVLWEKKAQERKDGRQTRADTKLEEAKKVHNTVAQAEGLLSAKTQDATKYLDEVVNELATIKAEALPEFEPEWFPTVWRA
jgi:hypothetical protein